MSKQRFEALLKSFKRSNSMRKQTLALKAGYATPQDYKEFLEKIIAVIVGQEILTSIDPGITEKVVVPVIHIVDILDRSTSMAGDKIKNANQGINVGIAKLKEDKSAKYTYTLCDFGGNKSINHKYKTDNLKDVGMVKIPVQGITALYDAIGSTIRLVKSRIKEGEKVLVNIYTDGGENDSKKFTKASVNELIKSVEENFTVTFIGTETDTESVINNLGISKSNTHSYDGSAQGLAQSMINTVTARQNFTSKVLRGQDVKEGFYKDIK